MSTPDPNNIYTENPGNLIYVSKKNWARKKNVEDNDPLINIIGRPGPITGLVLSIIDIIVGLFLKFVFYIFDITQYAFDWVNNITFINFQGIIPKHLVAGKVISTKFFRYTMNVLMPPFGIMLSKGIYGWFSIIICVLITYVNFFAGIVYAFILTSRNRYADQYEQYQLLKFQQKYPQKEADEDISACISSVSFIFVLIFVFYFIFSFF